MKTIAKTGLGILLVSFLNVGCGSQAGNVALSYPPQKAVATAQVTASEVVENDTTFSVQATKSTAQRLWEGIKFMFGDEKASYDSDKDDPWNS